MRCQSCGHENQPDHTFCAKCLEILDKKKTIVSQNQKSVAMPPQSEHLVDIKYSTHPPRANSTGWVWIVVALIIVGAVIFWFYG